MSDTLNTPGDSTPQTEKFDVDAYLAAKRAEQLPSVKPRSERTRREASANWMSALMWFVGALALIAFVGAGNLFGDSEFNGLAGLIAAVFTVAPTLPWIGLFHVLSRSES